MKELIEQTEIAKRIGISNNAMRRIATTAGLEFKLINNRRCYDWQEFLEAIKKGK
jgi:hypothetical protein